MSEVENRKSQSTLQEQLAQIHDLLQRRRDAEDLLRRHDSGGHQQRVESLLQRQVRNELQKSLDGLHPADIAYILEALPLEDRLVVWQMVKSDRDGDILLEVSDAVRESLIADMDEGEILAAIEPLDSDELADLVEDLPPEVLPELMASLDPQQREQVQSALSYGEDQVGAVMDFEMVTIREDVTLEVVLRYLRRFDELPEQTDKLFVLNQDSVLTGVLPLKWLVVNAPDKTVGEVMARDVDTFLPTDDADDAAQAFERYDLISAPVVDTEGRLIGRLTIDVMVDRIREESESEALGRAGLRQEEDIFSSVWASVRNRWSWLAINLVTAFLASRVIGLFQGSIEKLVVLATLMPIVASIGGSSGNQTIIKIVRAIATEQVGLNSIWRLWRKELGVAFFNGLIWGGVIGSVVALMYHDIPLGLVMTVAMVLEQMLAAVMGVGIPMLMLRLDRDPAMGSNIFLVFMTDSGGFFIFLGLASVFLLH
jgi:magnesium transporter